MVQRVPGDPAGCIARRPATPRDRTTVAGVRQVLDARLAGRRSRRRRPDRTREAAARCAGHTPARHRRRARRSRPGRAPPRGPRRSAKGARPTTPVQLVPGGADERAEPLRAGQVGRAPIQGKTASGAPNAVVAVPGSRSAIARSAGPPGANARPAARATRAYRSAAAASAASAAASSRPERHQPGQSSADANVRRAVVSIPTAIPPATASLRLGPCAGGAPAG